jgi:pimeloyl-ACP methyl ester carboxylesterase
VALRKHLARVRKVLLFALILLLLLSAAGAVYQAISVRRESERFHPPGRLVDVGGRRLHLVCIGAGEPTVVFEPSHLGGAGSSRLAREEIARSTRVCSYDRMGLGWSDPGPSFISAGVLSDDLEHLLDRAGLRPPYVLVASSIGGLTAELFARRHPDRVAGLVFLDAAYSGALERIFHEWTPVRAMEVCTVRVAARLGVLRLLDPLGLRRSPPDVAAADIAALYRVEPMATLCGMMRAIPQTMEDLRAAPPLAGDVPLTVLSAESSDVYVPPGYQAGVESLRREWLPLQLALAQRSSRGTWRVVPGSTHLIGNSKPNAVASAVFDVLAQAGR